MPAQETSPVSSPNTARRGGYARLVLTICRVAFTIAAGAVCLLFVVLWIRSYWLIEGGMFATFPGQHVSFHGGSGRMCVWFEHSPAVRWYDWNSRRNTSSVAPHDRDRMPWFDLAPFWPKMTRLYVAHWFLTVVSGGLALAPWVPRRFTLRGAMLAVTLVAVLAAVITWIDGTF